MQGTVTVYGRRPLIPSVSARFVVMATFTVLISFLPSCSPSHLPSLDESFIPEGLFPISFSEA